MLFRGRFFWRPDRRRDPVDAKAEQNRDDERTIGRSRDPGFAFTSGNLLLSSRKAVPIAQKCIDPAFSVLAPCSPVIHV